MHHQLHHRIIQKFGRLQVGEVGEDNFTVYLIPETLRVTVLGDKAQGDSVNIEIDAQTQVMRPPTAELALFVHADSF